MIQRLQSVLLFIAGCLMVCFIIFPLWEKVSADLTQKATLTALTLTHGTVDENGEIANVLNLTNTFYIAIIAGLSAIVAFYSIFRYDNRLLQMKLGALNSILIAVALIITFLMTKTGDAFFDENLTGKFQLGVFFAGGAFLLNSIANRFIRKDEKLVRSVDRIR